MEPSDQRQIYVYHGKLAMALFEHCQGRNPVAVADWKTLQRCMTFVGAVEALAVTRRGAVPSITSRGEVEDFLRWVDRLV